MKKILIGTLLLAASLVAGACGPASSSPGASVEAVPPASEAPATMPALSEEAPPASSEQPSSS